MGRKTDKHNRLQQLKIILKTHPGGLRKAEIARRLGVHRSTVGRYINELSLSLPLWESDSLLGIESRSVQEPSPVFNEYEGAFLLSLVRLYQQELNIKNPHASSAIRKISEGFSGKAPVISESMLEAAEVLDNGETLHSSGYLDNFEKLSSGWTNQTAVKTVYIHKSTGESCNTIFEPRRFFTRKDNLNNSELAICGLCRRTGELCRLRVSDFLKIDYPVVEIDIDKGYQNLFCPISELALNNRPAEDENRAENLSIKEANHRIKNSLFMASGLIDITFADSKDDDIQLKVQQLHSRVDTIAVLHGQLSEGKGSDLIDLKPFMTEITKKTVKIAALNAEDIKLKLKLNDIRLDSSKALPLGMIVSELIVNSFKHSSKDGKIDLSISISGVNGMVRLRYGDGGSGFQLKSERSSCGTELINSFCKQLGCVMKNKNNFFILEFPV